MSGDRERGAGPQRCGAFGAAGAGRTLHGKPAALSRPRQTPEGGRAGLRLGRRAAAGSGACSPPRSELHPTLRRLHVPAAQRGLGAPGCVSRAGPGPKNRSYFPGNGGEDDGQELRPVRNPRPGGCVGGSCFVRRWGWRSLLGSGSEPSIARRVSGCISIHRTPAAGPISRQLDSGFKYRSCVYAGQSGVELGGQQGPEMIEAYKYTTAEIFST